jgi:fructose-1,6-bisphosphatase/inositol monophosphatase family enzyme
MLNKEFKKSFLDKLLKQYENYKVVSEEIGVLKFQLLKTQQLVEKEGLKKE